MMFIDKCVHISRLIRNYISQLFVNDRAAMLHLIQHRVQDDDIAENIHFEYVDLVEHNICVQHQIMWKWEIGIQ